MPLAGLYIPDSEEELYERWKAIQDKPGWIKQHMDLDEKDKRPNVPRPPEMSIWRWNQHLLDHGFEVPDE